MAAKKSNDKVNVICMLALAVGIYLTINGVLSGQDDSLRALMMAAGLGIFAGGAIGYRPSKK